VYYYVGPLYLKYLVHEMLITHVAYVKLVSLYLWDVL